MRIAVVASTFQLGWMYIENTLAESLPETGHTVLVIGAGPKSLAPKFIPTQEGRGYQLQRISTWSLPRGIYLSYRDVKSAIEDFQPDLIYWIGPGRYFGYSLLHSSSLNDVPVISMCSEGRGWHEFDWRKSGISLKNRFLALAYPLLRGPMVRAACRRSSLVVGVTPETVEILQGLFARSSDLAEQSEKMVMVPLGFSIGVTKWDPKLRQVGREELRFEQEDVVVLVTSNFCSGKIPRLSMLISGIHGAMQQEPRLKALVVGMREGATSEKIRELIETGPFPNRFVFHEFTNQKRLNTLYNVADITLFNNPSNSVQMALGTGLYACLADKGSMSHLIRQSDQGIFYQQDNVEDMSQKLVASAQVIKKHLSKDHSSFRKHLAQESRWLGYDRIVDSILKCFRQRQQMDNSQIGESA